MIVRMVSEVWGCLVVSDVFQLLVQTVLNVVFYQVNPLTTLPALVTMKMMAIMTIMAMLMMMMMLTCAGGMTIMRLMTIMTVMTITMTILTNTHLCWRQSLAVRNGLSVCCIACSSCLIFS